MEPLNNSNQTSIINVIEFPYKWWQTFLIVIITVAILIGNILVIVTAQQIKNQCGNYVQLMINLACADLGVGLLVTPFSVVPSVTHKWPYGASMCRIQAYLATAFCCASMYSIACISFDRFIAIVRPLRYSQLLPKHRWRIMTGTIWIVVFVTCSPLLTGHIPAFYYDNLYVCLVNWAYTLEFSFLILFFVLLPSFIIIGITHITVYLISWRQMDRIKKEQIRFQNHHPHTKHHTSAVIGLMFFIAWIPFVAIQTQEDILERQHCGYFNETYHKRFCAMKLRPHAQSIHFIFGWLAFSNSFWNFIIYGALNKGFRHGFLRLFYCFKQSKLVNHPCELECTEYH